MINGDESLLRLVWNPRDFGPGDKLKGSAFSRGDLIPLTDVDGQPKYVSMDMMSIIDKASVDWNIRKAMGAGKGAAKEKRAEPKFAEFNCGEIRDLSQNGLDKAFEVIKAPIAEGEDGLNSPENLAHVGVQSLTPAPNDEVEQNVKVEELRVLLLASRRTTHSYSDVFGRAMVA